ncbi:MAG: hypothetical protein CL761_02085 [Chloroflexi bacterium]|nr:hypothetical protein [Chloroflexota bacterium]|tara:strand:- start:224 stop:883 length:660 start_codon:yes stop_codon:yes gene_type:complete
MNYFDLFPDVELPSFSDRRNSSKDLIRVKNLFKRGKIREDFFQNATTFYQYTITGDDRPDNVAKEVYDNIDLDWVVLLSNNILNIRDEWPMSQYDFQRYLNNKYDSVQLSQIHHYETKEIRNSNEVLLLQSGLVVNSDFTFKYTDPNTGYQAINDVTSVSVFQHETQKNDDKRSIFLLRPEYVSVIISDMREIMTYTDSSQYINRKLKKGDNIRIVEPR